MGRVPAFAVALLVLALLVLLLPERVPIPLRELSADPWTVLCVVPAMALPHVLSPRYDHMLAVLPTRIESLRAVVAGTCVSLTVVTIGGLAVLADHSLTVGLRNALGAMALCLLLCIVMSGEQVGVGLFAVAVAVWMFGRDSIGGEVEGWALLMLPATPMQVVVAGGLCLLAGLAWVRWGSAA
ncbi:hypothetical protein [Nocardioides sp.]|uniref:hypothetical protein n=1 Tax=Nocardioides sp. TaxID=35761 RepID=UPI0027369AFC|nr:hypothetical protein [Nocardioides sp.]MDP3890045.1 hypothetical protein [Nocardioides sp.]